jgi:hypothetical protein
VFVTAWKAKGEVQIVIFSSRSVTVDEGEAVDVLGAVEADGGQVKEGGEVLERAGWLMVQCSSRVYEYTPCRWFSKKNRSAGDLEKKTRNHASSASVRYVLETTEKAPISSQLGSGCVPGSSVNAAGGKTRT